MLTEYGHKIKEKVKAMKSEIKENVQGTSSEGKEKERERETSMCSFFSRVSYWGPDLQPRDVP